MHDTEHGRRFWWISNRLHTYRAMQSSCV